jgi:hypothetical protein
MVRAVEIALEFVLEVAPEFVAAAFRRSTLALRLNS